MTNRRKLVRISQHARDQMAERGADEHEVVTAIQIGELLPAKRGRVGFRMNVAYNRMWGGRTYRTKQVLVIVAEEADALIVVTVYTVYF